MGAVRLRWRVAGSSINLESQRRTDKRKAVGAVKRDRRVTSGLVGLSLQSPADGFDVSPDARGRQCLTARKGVPQVDLGESVDMTLALRHWNHVHWSGIVLAAQPDLKPRPLQRK
jgi:hypothetical protein